MFFGFRLRPKTINETGTSEIREQNVYNFEKNQKCILKIDYNEHGWLVSYCFLFFKKKWLLFTYISANTQLGSPKKGMPIIELDVTKGAAKLFIP